MDDADMIKHLRSALERISEPQAFYLPTAKVDPEAYARMIYAECILNGYTLKAASDKTEYMTRERYPLRGHSEEGV